MKDERKLLRLRILCFHDLKSPSCLAPSPVHVIGRFCIFIAEVVMRQTGGAKQVSDCDSRSHVRSSVVYRGAPEYSPVYSLNNSTQ